MSARCSTRQPRPSRTGSVLHFIDTGETFTYRDLRAAVNRLANGAHGGRRAQGNARRRDASERTGMADHLARLARIGAVAVPVNTRYTARELHYALDDGAADYLVIHESFLTVLAGVPEPVPRIAGRVIVVGEASGEHRGWRELIEFVRSRTDRRPTSPVQTTC